MIEWALIPIYLIAVKSILIGSEFNLYYWVRYGKHYTEWYGNRETYTPQDKGE